MHKRSDGFNLQYWGDILGIDFSSCLMSNGNSNYVLNNTGIYDGGFRLEIAVFPQFTIKNYFNEIKVTDA